MANIFRGKTPRTRQAIKCQSWLWIMLCLLGCQTEPLPTPTAVSLITPSIITAVPTHTPMRILPTVVLATATPPPSYTPLLVPPTASATSTAVPPTQTATATATATPKLYATIDVTTYPPGTAVPTPIPPFPKGDNIINIILLGNDVATSQGGRTDSLILVSINRESKSVTMLSLPRDIFVVIPGWQMTRINLALPHGHGSDYPGGGGALIKDTIEYNLGIPVDYYARIGFNGFKEAVDAVGGIEMVVNCPLTDWRLISPDLDPEVEENWERFTLASGIHQMDGDLALWFARSRRSTNDFERGLRQQRVLQAIFQQSLQADILSELPDLWQAYQHNIETDMSLSLLVELASLAPTIAENGIRHLTLPLASLRSWRDPANGASVQLLDWETAAPVLSQLMQPPALNRATGPGLVVAVVTDDMVLYRQTADNLAWFGFMPQHEAMHVTSEHTQITYYGPNRKGSYDWLLSWLFHRETADIALAPDEDSDVDYRVWLGHDTNPCLPYLQSPQAPGKP